MMMQGDSTFQLGMLAHIKRAHPGIEVIGGNIVTTYQVRRVWRGVEGHVAIKHMELWSGRL